MSHPSWWLAPRASTLPIDVYLSCSAGSAAGERKPAAPDNKEGRQLNHSYSNMGSSSTLDSPVSKHTSPPGRQETPNSYTSRCIIRSSCMQRACMVHHPSSGDLSWPPSANMCTATVHQWSPPPSRPEIATGSTCCLCIGVASLLFLHHKMNMP